MFLCRMSDLSLFMFRFFCTFAPDFVTNQSMGTSNVQKQIEK